jgi:3-hydroxymyristoyl/3-hydroxydecanoyl-(acyl carrier protein) dehydratase
MLRRVPLDPAFVADCPYGPDGLLIDEILEIRKSDGFVAVRMPTYDDLPLTRTQRCHPLRHPRHVSGGLMVHMTGMVALVHTYYVLELRHADGWVGYGARIRAARFHAMARPGDPMRLTCLPLQLRRGDKSVLARYEFKFYQNDTLIYEGDQTAMFTRVQVPEDQPIAG